MTKLGLSFHRTFSLRRSSVAQVVNVAVKRHKACDHIGVGLSYGELREETSLGTVDVQASARYAVGLGLLTLAYIPTPFGLAVNRFDPTMSLPQTQWIMHYFMTADQHAGPTFWKILILSLRIGSTVTRDELVRELSKGLGVSAESPAPEIYRKAATAFAGSYTKEDGFNSLRILQVASKSNEYADLLVCEPEPPSPCVISYLVADYWAGVLDGRQSVNLESLTGRQGLAGLLLMHTGDMNEALKQMQTDGLVELQRQIPPYQVYRLWRSNEELLARIYQP